MVRANFSLTKWSFVGSQKLPRTVRLVSGGPVNQRGVCGSFPGVPKTSAEFAAHFRGSRKPARIVRLISGGPENQRGLCGSFPGVPKTSADCAAHFRGSRKSARIVRLISGGPENQRGECGTFSGGHKSFRGTCGKPSQTLLRHGLSAFISAAIERKMKIK